MLKELNRTEWLGILPEKNIILRYMKTISFQHSLINRLISLHYGTPLNALRKGYGLNKKAKKKNNYSSMIFVAKQK